MPNTLAANASSVGEIGMFSGNFTKAIFLRRQPATEIERRLGYGAGRLSGGWWLLFALERPAPSNFEFGGLTTFSGLRVGPPHLGNARMRVEESLAETVGSPTRVTELKGPHVAGLALDGMWRLAKVIPVKPGNEYPAGTGIYQCNILNPIRCKVAAFVPPGEVYSGGYD